MAMTTSLKETVKTREKNNDQMGVYKLEYYPPPTDKEQKEIKDKIYQPIYIYKNKPD